MTKSTIRWQQRFHSYKRALALLSEFMQKDQLNELQTLGSIHAFEMTYDIAGKLLIECAKSQNISDIYGPRDAMLTASNVGLIDQPDSWTDMLETRRETNEVYRTEIAEKIAVDIRSKFFALLLSLQ
ncbi:MAG: nucleotidyltransferase substrate binding protein [Cyanobacteria bacterium J06621_3]